MTTALVIGAGPAGLMAAEALGRAGAKVIIADQMPSPARKFLMAGKSGLNLTKNEPLHDVLQRYAPHAPALRAALTAFGPKAVMDWAGGLGQPLFTGSTGRVFPKAMKASPLLRAWLARLNGDGVTLLTRHRWTGFGEDNAARFETPDGTRDISADAIVLAMGGASWAGLGSDGRWADTLPDANPFRPANCGFVVAWSDHMAPHLGDPIKGTALTAGPLISRGEWVISSRGIEGGGVYEVSAAVRDGAPLMLDLLPDRSIDAVRAAMDKRGKTSISSHLRKALRLSPAKIALLQEFGRPLPGDLAPLLKALPIRHSGPRPLDEAISVAGGLRFEGLDENLMLRQRAGVFAAGEMLDWEAPTGGYLLTACFATGAMAGRSAARYLGLAVG